MTIFHLRASNFYGGPERQLHLHAVQAVKAGYDLIIGSFTELSGQPEFLKIIAADSLETHCFDVSSAYSPRSVVALRKYLNGRGVGILCTHDYRSQILGFLATRRTRTKWVAFSRGSTQENIKVKLFQQIANRLIGYADHIVAVSGSEKDKLRRLKIDESMISVVPNSIDINLVGQAPRVDLHKRFGFPHDAIICATAGRFSPEKGQIHLVRAAHQAIRRNSKLRFVLFGDGPDLANIRANISVMDLQDRIKCPGFERNMAGCLKGASLLINPSISEGLPNVVLEAMALKIPVIATAVGGVPELIHHGENGILVPPANEKALSNALLELVNFWPLSQKIVDRAFETVSDYYSFDRQLQSLAGIYEMLLARIREEQ